MAQPRIGAREVTFLVRIPRADKDLLDEVADYQNKEWREFANIALVRAIRREHRAILRLIQQSSTAAVA